MRENKDGMGYRVGLATLALLCVALFSGCAPDEPQSPASNQDAAPASQQQVGTRGTAALPDTGFRAQLTLSAPLPPLRAGQREVINVRVRNVGDAVWPALGRNEGESMYAVTLRNSWLSARDREVVNNLDGGRVLPYDLRPGEEVELPLVITAPANRGEYILQLDMVQEQVAWFQDKGSTAAEFPVQIE